MQQFNDSLIESVQKDIGDVELYYLVLQLKKLCLVKLSKILKDTGHIKYLFLMTTLRPWEVVANKNQAFRTCFVPTAIYGNKDAILLISAIPLKRVLILFSDIVH